MTTRLSILLIFLILIDCSDYETETYTSKTGNYSVKATVNRTNKKAEDYSYVIIHIYNKNKEEIQKINSRAGDLNKWSLGWTPCGDTIILQNSDIGDQAWTIIDGEARNIEMTKELYERAKELKKENYK